MMLHIRNLFVFIERSLYIPCHKAYKHQSNRYLCICQQYTDSVGVFNFHKRNYFQPHNVMLCRKPFIEGSHFHTSSVTLGREFYLDKDVALRVADDAKNFPFAVHELQFKTCEDLNHLLVHSFDGVKRSLTGITFNVTYVDTDPNARTGTPVVLALHGTPGNHLDFKEIVTYLAKKGIRVIVPNFPGYGWTPTDVDKEFRHSYIEKTCFVKDFLKCLNISKVDLIITHSAGTYPALLLSSEFQLAKSLLLINPGGLSMTRALKLKSYFRLHTELYRNWIFRHLALINLKILLTLAKFGNTNAHHMSVAIESLFNVNYEACKTCVQNLALKHFPVAIIYSESDRVVDKDQFEEYVHLFGADLDDAFHYDKDGELIRSASKANVAETHIFDGGGHFVMKKYPDSVNNIVHQFFQKTSRK